MVVGVAMSAPTNKEQDTKAPVNVVSTKVDTEDFVAITKEILPIIRESIALFAAPGTPTTSFSAPATSVGNVGGVDSSFVPNYVIPGYTIPGNRFSPNIHIPSIHIQ